MSNEQPQEARRLVSVGGRIVLLENVFEVIAHTTDKNGRAVEVPGRCLGKAPAQSSAATRTAASPRSRKARFTPAQRYAQRHQPKPPPLKLVYEPMSAAAVWGWVVVLALIVAGLWLYNAGSEARKWEQIEGAARAVRGR
jgi:hypothetical protein